MILEYKSVVTSSGSCGYVTLGSGSPLVMVLGYTGTLFHWHSGFIYELAKRYTLYLIDNRRIGQSNSNNEESMPGFARDIADFIDALAIPRPYILGWSMGGIFIQELLKGYPDKVSAVILLATVPAISYTNPDFFAFVRNYSKISAEEYRRGIYYYFFSHDKHENTRDELANNALKFSNYAYRFTLDAKTLQDNIIQNWPGISATDLAKIQVPTLLLWAKNDLVVGSSAALFFATHMPVAKLIFYPSGGHFLLQDNYQQIANDIANFISYQIC